MKAIWITWETQPRNWETARGLGAKYFEFSDLAHVPYYKKYVLGPLRTLKTMWQEKPDVVFCENPSFMLALTVVIFKRVFRYKAIVDTHNGGLLLTKGRILKVIGHFLRRFADITIVTNAELAKVVDASGGASFVLPDCVPNIQPTAPGINEQKLLVCISSYADDEPYANVFRAAMFLPHVRILMTGNHKKQRIVERFIIPDNVVFLGYLPRSQYETVLRNADAIVALSTKDNCLLCGNYEAVAVERPLITSNTAVIRQHFNKGAMYCDNTTYGIVDSIQIALAIQGTLIKEMRELKLRLVNEWDALARNLLQVVNG